MNFSILIFLFVAVLTTFAALVVVTNKNLVSAAMWLIVALFGAALTFVLLEATYIAVVQVVVYIGAIAVLIVFTIMLTRRSAEKEPSGATKQWPIAAVLSLALFSGLTYFYLTVPGTDRLAPVLDKELNMVSALGQLLVSPSGYVLPFELASVLLLAALIGSIVVAWRK